jgi:hypothetical protein
MTTTFEPFTSPIIGMNQESIHAIKKAYDTKLGYNAIKRLTIFCSMHNFVPTIQNLQSIIQQFNSADWVEQEIKEWTKLMLTSPPEMNHLVNDVNYELRSHTKTHVQDLPLLNILNEHSPDFIVTRMFFPQINSMEIVLQMILETGLGLPRDVILAVNTVYNGSTLTLTKKYDWTISGTDFSYEETQSIKALEMPTNNNPEMYNFLVDVFSWFLHSRNFSTDHQDNFIGMFSIVHTFAENSKIPKVLRDLAKASLQNPRGDEMKRLFADAKVHMSS